LSRPLVVAAVSPQIVLGDTAGNIARCAASIAEAVRRDARLVVLPELAVSGYVFHDAAEARAAATTRADAIWHELTDVIPEGAVAVVGYAEDAGDAVYNSAAVLTRGRRIGDYRKSHLWGAESSLFSVGDTAGSVYDTPIGRLGVAICYDNEFPEVPRGLALAGAEVLALPVNWPLVDRPAGEHPPETIQAMAAARSSRLPTVIADRVGLERGVEWTHGTAVIDGEGWIAALPDDDGFAVARLTLADPGDKSLPPFNDLFGDRRPELY
jgi:predicted amidohydrolase